MIEERHNILASLMYKNIMFRFVKQSANRVAHCLARYGYLITDRSCRLKDVHSEFNNFSGKNRNKNKNKTGLTYNLLY